MLAYDAGHDAALRDGCSRQAALFSGHLTEIGQERTFKQAGSTVWLSAEPDADDLLERQSGQPAGMSVCGKRELVLSTPSSPIARH